ncbi:MAG: exodeoxyribonuclease VII large subunit [Clostridia bacterium]|nr:exodeoxyribonuclease VII large subunit [Clostridia bacterium]
METLSVSQVNEYVKMLLDSDAVLTGLSVSGEISNFKRHYSGHIYFSLKDAGGALKCVMFAGNAAGLGFLPKDGDRVVAHGRVSVFPRDGVYQLYVSALTRAGLGELYAEFERLKKKLAAEGLFDAARKRQLPPFPREIGIVTSATGAAVRDMKNVLGRRWPAAKVVICPALVQGPGAPASIIAGIDRIESETAAELIIIGRGGGSFEDLSCFNDEALARRVAGCRIPVISAVGHETDYVLTDFVADLRAPTPSAAAELAVPDASEILHRIISLGSRVETAVMTKLRNASEALERTAALPALSSPGRMLDVYDENLASLTSRIYHSFRNIVELRAEKTEKLAASLKALSPVAVLERGYAIVRRESGETVASAEELHADDRIGILMSDGEIPAVVSGPFKGGNPYES